MSIDQYRITIANDMAPAELLESLAITYAQITDRPAAMPVDLDFSWSRMLSSEDYFKTNPDAGIEVPQPVRGFMLNLGNCAIRNSYTTPFASYPDLEAREKISDIRQGTASWLWRAANYAIDHPPPRLSGLDPLRGRSSCQSPQVEQDDPSRIIGLRTTSLYTIASEMMLNPEVFGVDPHDAELITAGTALLLLAGRETIKSYTPAASTEPVHPALQKLRHWKEAIYQLDSIDRLDIGVGVKEALEDRGYRRLSHLVHYLGTHHSRLPGITRFTRQQIWREIQHALPAVREDMIREIARVTPLLGVDLHPSTDTVS